MSLSPLTSELFQLLPDVEPYNSDSECSNQSLETLSTSHDFDSTCSSEASNLFSQTSSCGVVSFQLADKYASQAQTVQLKRFHQPPSTIPSRSQALAKLMENNAGTNELSTRYDQQTSLLIPEKGDWEKLKLYHAFVKQHVPNPAWLTHDNVADKLREQYEKLYDWLVDQRKKELRHADSDPIVTRVTCFIDWFTVSHLTDDVSHQNKGFFNWRTLPEATKAAPVQTRAKRQARPYLLSHSASSKLKNSSRTECSANSSVRAEVNNSKGLTQAIRAVTKYNKSEYNVHKARQKLMTSRKNASLYFEQLRKFQTSLPIGEQDSFGFALEQLQKLYHIDSQAVSRLWKRSEKQYKAQMHKLDGCASIPKLLP
ncbi:MAG: hypothetical protein ACPGUD_08545 [Parashewanella sp.]